MRDRIDAIPGGRHSLSREEVRANRRVRLIAAMIESVGRNGYPGTTIERLVALARIGKTDFYGVFSSKEECFWATFDDCLERFAGVVEARVAEAEPGPPQVAAVIEAMADVIEAEPDVVSLVLVDSLALGPEADDPRARSQVRFESMLLTGVKAAGGSEMRELRARGVVIGLRRLAYRAIRDGDAAGLRHHAPTLTEWIHDYASLPQAKVRPGRRPATTAPAGPSWDEPPDSQLSRSTLTSRERILRACAQLLVEGDAVPSIPAISARAGTSNQTLYREFGGKEEAVLAAFDALIEPTLEAVEVSLEAPDDDPAVRIARSIAELRARLTSEPLLADLTFRDLPRLGRPGLERIDVAMGRITEMLLGTVPGRRGAKRDLRAQATVGGLWGIMRTAAMGGGKSVATPSLFDFVLVGILGSTSA